MVLHVYLAGTVMLIFIMGLYGLFISNIPHDISRSVDRSLKGSSLWNVCFEGNRKPYIHVGGTVAVLHSLYE
ncbi:transmembrane protein, putative [Medicago truncatula]|uniref:Transmembrane protein, putative n=1 Tax=Medicago truncatula TaxID=3880 RepID=G7IWZ1_MEDTR|nr:transmembrane protein, putative [Medicago truncatula]